MSQNYRITHTVFKLDYTALRGLYYRPEIDLLWQGCSFPDESTIAMSAAAVAIDQSFQNEPSKNSNVSKDAEVYCDDAIEIEERLRQRHLGVLLAKNTWTMAERYKLPLVIDLFDL